MTTIPIKDFTAMRTELESLDERREELIILSRKVNQLAKKAMYETHRNNLENAQKIFSEVNSLADDLKESYASDRKFKIGAVTASLQEWAECYAYYIFVKEGRLISQEETGLETEDYLLALADFTGEITRRAVLLSIEKDKESVKELRIFVDDILGEFLAFNFRNGELRKKTDAIRWNLQKIEELLVR
jgi:predicted translin family RNA/ssDNA-binding protein